jgi:protein-disulfide isomerase
LLNQVLEAYPTQVRFVYKQFPLPMHQNARPASEASMFAKAHGKFWEMHDLLFENFGSLTMDNIKSFARKLGLDDKAMEASITSQAFKAEIEKDIADAGKAAVNSTPTIFINGKRLQNRSFDGFKQMIDDALKAKGSETASK